MLALEPLAARSAPAFGVNPYSPPPRLFRTCRHPLIDPISLRPCLPRLPSQLRAFKFQIPTATRDVPNVIFPCASLQHQSSQLPPEPQPLPQSNSVSVDVNADIGHPSFWVAAATELIAGLLAIVLCILTKLPILGANFTLSARAFLSAIQITVPFTMAFWLVEKVPTGIKQQTEERFRQFFQSRSYLDVALFCACVAFGEELLFRAWLLSALQTFGLKSFYALLVSSTIFGAFHAYTPVYVLLASIAGAMFGVMFIATGNMLHPILVHFLYDFATIVIFKFRWRSSQSRLRP